MPMQGLPFDTRGQVWLDRCGSFKDETFGCSHMGFVGVRFAYCPKPAGGLNFEGQIYTRLANESLAVAFNADIDGLGGAISGCISMVHVSLCVGRGATYPNRRSMSGGTSLWENQKPTTTAGDSLTRAASIRSSSTL